MEPSAWPGSRRLGLVGDPGHEQADAPFVRLGRIELAGERAVEHDQDAPQSLTDDEVYAVTAFVLAKNGIIAEDEELNARTLPAVKMPNRDGFVSWWPLPGGD